MASLTLLFPRNANERFDTPPEVNAPGRLVFIHLTASMKSIPYRLCSSIPVPIERILASNIMFSGDIPAFSVSSLYALEHISVFLSYVVAWPSSSNAIMTIAAP